jgi:hypothetical protein
MTQHIDFPLRTEHLNPLPLPTSQTTGNSRRARDHQIFSRPWLRYRTLHYLALALLIGVTVSFVAFSAPIDRRAAMITIAKCTVPFLTFPVLGPALATWICSRRPGHRVRAWMLTGAIVLGGLGAWGINNGADLGLRASLFGDSHADLGLQTSVGIFVRPRTPALATGAKTMPPAVTPTVPDHPHTATGAEWFGQSLLLGGIFWLSGGLDLILFFRRRREWEEAARQKALAQAIAARSEAEQKLSILAAQVEPHFLFNTLAGVRSAIVSDPTRAVVIIDHLVDYLRASIPRLRCDGAQVLSTVADQLDIVRAYLGIMSARIPRLSFTIFCPNELLDAPMPPLMLISLTENAVKHGIEPKVGPGCITVRISCQSQNGGAMLMASVDDDGVGFGGKNAGNGIGLVNIRERLKAMYGNDASLWLTEREDGGMRASLQIPLAAQ